jgi:DNA-binding LacI/PurR family transcriptional regulator
MANAAVQLVLDRLKNPRERGMTLAIEGNLVVRSSTAPAPAAASS